MESTGEMLCMEHIVELRDSHALEFCAHPSDEYKTYAEDKKPRRQKLRNNTGSLRFVGGGVIAEQDVQGGGDEDLIDTKEAKDLADRIVRNGLVGMKGKLAMSRQQVDTVLQSFGNSASCLLEASSQ
ncbi:hypothetical protein Pcac1_g5515 [Phytophthora cactorum]|nr:hypothetical protein Pcac1_g5515 [Phytophthora cactorum]